jgi:fatty acid CoA ligase FadD32
VTGVRKRDEPSVHGSTAEAGGPPAYVSCGHPVPGQDLMIWDSDSGRAAETGAMGEIWLRGPNVTRGYWRDAEKTAETFGATVPGIAGPWLRTGDLGFMTQAGLHVCGRRSSQIVVRGRNHSLEDIERTASGADPNLAGYICAAFPVAEDGEEKLVVVHEAPRSARAPELRTHLQASIRRGVARTHGITPLAVEIVPLGTVPRTRSGKVQRHRCSEIHPSW